MKIARGRKKINEGQDEDEVENVGEGDDGGGGRMRGSE